MQDSLEANQGLSCTRRANEQFGIVNMAKVPLSRKLIALGHVMFQGIQILVDALEVSTHANPSHEMLGEYTTAVLNALWDCVVTNRRNLAHLLADDGLGDLLDAIEACHAAVQPVALAVLAGETLTCGVHVLQKF